MSNTAIIDLDSVAYTIFHPNKKVNELGIPLKEDGKFIYVEKTEQEILESVDTTMKEILDSSKATNYIAFIKGKGNYRYAINSEYKANRKSEPPKYWNLVKQLLIDRWGAVPVDGIEVDDAVNIAYKNTPNSFRCAIDKDILYLEGHNYDWRRKKWSYISKEEAYHKFWGDMIIGQPIDNIKGIPGKGPKFVEGLLSGEMYEIVYYHTLVFDEYVRHFGEQKGIQEFYKNYTCLHILENSDGFVIPEAIEYNKNVEELF